MSDSIYSLASGLYNQRSVRLTSLDGAIAEIYLNGAHVTSWKTPDGEEQLFLSPRSKFGAETAIRGGIPVIFPQFSGEGPLPKHGFARKQQWEFVKAVESGHNVKAHFQVWSDQETLAVWPHEFLNAIEVEIGGNELKISLTVSNTNSQPFSFTAALHSYFKISDIAKLAVKGLGGYAYLDTVGERIMRVQTESNLTFDGQVDRIYYDAPNQLALNDGNRHLTIETGGFPDAVIWNPWAELAASLEDMEPGGYRQMVCIEAAVVGNPVELKPGQSWSGYQRIKKEITNNE